jgi:protein ImuB
MPRVASLYLPNLPTDRLRRIDSAAWPDGSTSAAAGRLKSGEVAARRAAGDAAWIPAARLPENSKERAKLVALRERMARQSKEGEPGARIEDCSCPRGGGWRPGASWSRREALQAEIDTLPTHQRPLIQELGRRTEPAKMPFRTRTRQVTGESGGPALKSSQFPAFAGEQAPLVTVHRVGNRMEVAAACPAAKALGLHPAMPVTQARIIVPGLDLREAQPEADHALLTRLGLFAARRWTPKAALCGASGLWLDLGGVTHLFGGERRMCERILRFCARLGLAARIAVAGTPGAAHALARHGSDPITLCPPSCEGKAIASLPLAALRIEEDVLSAARRLGIEQVGDLIAMPRGPLNRRFGKTLLIRLDQALGRVPEPFDPIVPQDPPCATLRLAEPIATAEAIDQVLDDLMISFVGALEKQGLAAKRTMLVCFRVDGEEQRLGIGTARATRDGKHLLRLLRMKIERIEPGFGIEAMQLVAERWEPLAPQPVESALGGGDPEPDLVPLIDRLASRLGTRRLFRSSAVESDVPERSIRRVSPLAATASWPEWPRPVRLLSPPERVDKVMAELPDQAPVRFFWRGQVHKVRRADGPERIYGEWWKHNAEAHSVRDYFRVESEEGARFWLYRRGDGLDTRTGDLSWWMQGMFG